jgi:hypothetical protein
VSFNVRRETVITVQTDTDSTTRQALLDLAAQQTTTDLPTAGRFFGMGTNASYESYHRGDFPCRVLKLGKRLRVPTADILRELGIAGSVDAA